jgi:hypothetical protein
MAVYALVDDDNIVIDIKGGDAEWVQTQSGRWIETDPDTIAGQHRYGGTPLRKNYAQMGYTYDETLDAFIPPKPVPSYVIDTATGQWVPPVVYPTDGGNYSWNETRQEWEALNRASQGEISSLTE